MPKVNMKLIVKQQNKLGKNTKIVHFERHEIIPSKNTYLHGFMNGEKKTIKINNKRHQVTEIKPKNKITIPIWQRQPAWAKKEFKEFVQSIMSVYKHKDFHPMHEVIIYVSEGIVYIVDGQQRMLANTLFLAGIKHVLDNFFTRQSNSKEGMYVTLVKNNNYVTSKNFIKNFLEAKNNSFKNKSNKKVLEDLKNKINNLLLTETKHNGEKQHLTFDLPKKYTSKSSQDGRKLYENYILDNGNIEKFEKEGKKFSSIKSIKDEYHFYLRFILRIIQKSPNVAHAIKSLEELYEASAYGLLYNISKTYNYDKALQSYITKNNFGKASLSIPATIKADVAHELVLSKISEKVMGKNMKSYSKIGETMKDNPKLFGKYLSAYWTVTHHNVEGKKLIKDIINNLDKGNVENFLSNLFNLKDVYYDIKYPKVNNTLPKIIGKKFSKKINELLISLKKIGFKQFYPIILAMALINQLHESSLYKSRDFVKILKSIINMYIRHLIVNENHTKFNNIAHEIYSKNNNSKPFSTQEILKKIYTLDGATGKAERVINGRNLKESINMYTHSKMTKTMHGKNANKDDYMYAMAVKSHYGKLFIKNSHRNDDIFDALFSKVYNQKTNRKTIDNRLVTVNLFTIENNGIYPLNVNNPGNFILIEDYLARDYKKMPTTKELITILSKSKVTANKELLKKLNNVAESYEENKTTIAPNKLIENREEYFTRDLKSSLELL